METTWRVTNRLAGKLRAGIILFRGLKPIDPGALDSFISESLEKIRAGHSKELPAGYEFSRRLYRSVGVDPTRHRPSSEALWRRLRDRGDFPRVSLPVDLANLLALKFQVPYGLHDRGFLMPPLELDLGRAGESYEGIRKETLNMEGKIALRDARGPCGNPSADSARAAVRDTTADLLLLIYCHPGDTRCREILDETLALYRRFFTAEAESEIV